VNPKTNRGWRKTGHLIDCNRSLAGLRNNHLFRHTWQALSPAVDFFSSGARGSEPIQSRDR
jgi:hypothetical protein